MKRVTWMVLSALLLAGALPASAQSRGRAPRGRSAYDQSSSQPAPAAGQRWEKIPIQYMDVRTLAAILGAPVLPTEADLFGGDLFGASVGSYSTSYGFYGSGFGNVGPAFGQPGGFNQPGAFGQPGGFSQSGGFSRGGGPGPVGNPGPAGQGSGGLSGGTPGPQRFGLQGNQGGRPGQGPLFPGLVILADPNTNSLLVDP
jgi:hypothetical protein